VKISALISPCLPKYGWNGFEKRGAPGPFKSRFVFPGVLPVWGEICPKKGCYRALFLGVGKKGYIILYLNPTVIGFDNQRGPIPRRMGFFGNVNKYKKSNRCTLVTDSEQDARRFCQACYKAEQEAAVPLPGTVDVSRCERDPAEITGSRTSPAASPCIDDLLHIHSEAAQSGNR